MISENIGINIGVAESGAENVAEYGVFWRSDSMLLRTVAAGLLARSKKWYNLSNERSIRNMKVLNGSQGIFPHFSDIFDSSEGFG